MDDFKLVFASCWLKEHGIPKGNIRYDADRRFHALDVVAACSSCQNPRKYASRQLKRLLDSGSMSVSDFVEVTLLGESKEKVKLVEFKDLLKLVMALPTTSNRRKEFSRVLHSYFAGDEHLFIELRANAGSSKKICEIARECLNAERAAATTTTLGAA
jgi:hypothetical protein